MLKKLPKAYNTKKIFFFIILILTLHNPSLAKNIQDVFPEKTIDIIVKNSLELII